MPAPSRSEAPLGSRDSIEDDLRLVRYHGGLADCPSSDFVGTVGLLAEASGDSVDLVQEAKDIHLRVGNEFFETLANGDHRSDQRWQIASKVLRPTMYQSRGADGLDIVTTRSIVADEHRIAATTVIGYENSLLRHLAGIVHDAGHPHHRVNSGRKSRLTPNQRRVVKRTQRHLNSFLFHWDGPRWALSRELNDSSSDEDVYDPSSDEMMALAEFLTFVDSIVKEFDEGHEGPVLSLHIDPDFDSEFDGWAEAIETCGPEWSDDAEADWLLETILSGELVGWFIEFDLWRVCRLTRSIERTDTANLLQKLESFPEGRSCLAGWESLCSCYDRCDDNCAGIDFQMTVLRLQHLISTSLENHKRDKELWDKEVRAVEYHRKKAREWRAQRRIDLEARRRTPTVEDSEFPTSEQLQAIARSIPPSGKFKEGPSIIDAIVSSVLEKDSS